MDTKTRRYQEVIDMSGRITAAPQAEHKAVHMVAVAMNLLQILMAEADSGNTQAVQWLDNAFHIEESDAAEVAREAKGLS